MKRRHFSLGALSALGAAGLVRISGARAAASPTATSIDRIKHWVVVMFENRSFDSLLGHLPHIAALILNAQALLHTCHAHMYI